MSELFCICGSWGHFTSTLTKNLEFVWCYVLVRPCGCRTHCELLSNRSKCWLGAVSEPWLGSLLVRVCWFLQSVKACLWTGSTAVPPLLGWGVCAQAVRLCSCAASLLVAAHPRGRYLQEYLGVLHLYVSAGCSFWFWGCQGARVTLGGCCVLCVLISALARGPALQTCLQVHL